VLKCLDFSGSNTLIEDNPNWRRHKGACANYRERWSPADEPGDEGCRLLYQIVCLLGTPPVSAEEQARCMGTTTGCWRLKEPARGRRPVGAASA
jgi:hypothetical protein